MRISYKGAASWCFFQAGLWAIGLGPSFAEDATQASAASPQGGLQEVIVTAQRRSEKEQDVPMSISVASGEQLTNSNVSSIRDLSVTAPGLVIGGVGANMAPAIRGVHSDQSDPGNDANVALYVDGVYMPNQVANNIQVEDINRLEVLMGPQGTLFGRNATGGAIRFFTLEPSLREATGFLDLGGGNDSHATANGFVSLPLVDDKLAVSVSGHYDRIDGYNYDIVHHTETDPSQDYLFRAKILAKPIDSLTIELFGVSLHQFDGDGTAYLALNGNSYARNIPGAIIPSQPYTYTTATNPSALRADQNMAGLRVNWQTQLGELSSLTAYISDATYYSNDASASSVNVLSYPVYESEYTTEQELTFASKEFNHFAFTVGANYYGDSGRYDPLILEGLFIGPTPSYGYFKQRTDAYGIFGEVNWNPIDRLTLIAGTRYSSERRSAYGSYYGSPAGAPVDLPAIGVPTTFSSNTPRGSIRYRLTDQDDNVYFTFSQGFKSGGFNLAGLQPTPFLPEKLYAYQVGLKTSQQRLFSGNLALYYYDYKDIQVQALNGNTNTTTNAASARMYGIDAQLAARLTHDLTLRAGWSYLNSMYIEYLNAPALVPIGGPTCMCGNESISADFNGRTTPFAPRNSGSVGADYTTSFKPGTLGLTATYFFSSKYLMATAAQVYQEPFETLALRANFRFANSGFSIYGWGKNVTNRKYLAYGFSSVAADAYMYARGRTYGAGAKYEF